MRSFFKILLATFTALVIFTLILIFFFAAWLGNLATKDRPQVESNSVLVLDLSQHYREQVQNLPFASLLSDRETDIPGVYDVVRMLHKAATDDKIKGIYIMANVNANGFAASEEIRNALLTFKTSKKFIIAHADILTQKSYHIANVADKIYANPTGVVEWNGFSADLAFVKGTLDKLEIEPQIFYAGKFKSATEPFRTDKMTPENREQTTEWLNDLYSEFLLAASKARNIDTATLHAIANEGQVWNPQQALQHKLIDGIKYDDEVKDEIKSKLNLGKYDRINFITVNKYGLSVGLSGSGKDRIAVIYAEGDIVDGNGDDQTIGSESFRRLIRKARLDKNIKAIVFRINSGGGSALASENILRELILAKKEKPVVVSFGDVAASGGYYIACAADSIFASPNTITGSIGVFGIIPNMQGFFKNKLGVTFDGVKTAPYADAGAIYRPLTENERKIVQSQIENIYSTFKQRVAEGRKKDTAQIEAIAQGRVWSGKKALELGLIDRFGGLHDAVACAARLAKTTDYRLREYPQPENLIQKLLGSPAPMDSKIRTELGEENFRIFSEMKRVKQLAESPQARLPFQFFIR